jgi:hypothetical protein
MSFCASVSDTSARASDVPNYTGEMEQTTDGAPCGASPVFAAISGTGAGAPGDNPLWPQTQTDAYVGGI